MNRSFNRNIIDRGVMTVLVGLLLLDIVAGFSSKGYPTQATPMALVGAVLGFLIVQRKASQNEGGTALINDDERAIRRDNALLSFGLGVALLAFGAFFTFYNIINTLTQPIKAPDQIKIVDIVFIVVFNILVIGVEVVGYRAYISGRKALGSL